MADRLPRQLRRSDPVKPTILYLNTDPGARIPQMTLAGMRRYASARGWTAEAFSSKEVGKDGIPALLADRAPVVGCVYECSDDNLPASPGIFGGLPVVYLHASSAPRSDRIVQIPTDNEAVARTAFRELSVGCPAAFAIVGNTVKVAWSMTRERVFRALAAEAGVPCRAFRRRDETHASRAARLAAWVAGLPRHCAIFAVNDLVAAEVVAAARAAHRAIPRELTLLGVDNLAAICENSHPTISSIQIDFERAGYVAASMLAATIKGRAKRGIKGRAAHGTKGLASLEIKGAACAANGGISSFGGNAATLNCAAGAPSLPAKRAPSFGGNAATLNCTAGAPSLPEERAHAGVAVIGPLLVVRRESTSGWGRREAFVLQAVERIRREACEGLTAHDVIAAAPVSRSLFILRFREAVGHSVQDEIEHVRMERVFTLLRDTKTPISAVAALCGWRSDIALRWLFRRRTGMSMRQWRRENT